LCQRSLSDDLAGSRPTLPNKQKAARKPAAFLL
jgi:hypothetical protein